MIASSALSQYSERLPASHRSILEHLQQTGISLPNAPLFGTDGIRGRVGELLTAPLALQVGYWAGRTLQAHFPHSSVVIIGQDSRNSSPMLSMSLSAGLTAAGLEVWNLGLCPTPAVAYLTHRTGAAGGIMVSASHNPPEDNGIKFFGADGTKLSPTLQAQIEAGLRGQGHPADTLIDRTLRLGQSSSRAELLQQYSAALYQSLPASASLSGMRIVLDLAWGAAAHLGAPMFRSLGAEVICLHDQPDGDRINVHCGSTHLAALQTAVQSHQADMGFAFDGDADRVMAVDEQGRIIDGDYILYLWGQQLRQLQQLPGNILVSTVMANLGFERAWQQSGGQLCRTAVGDQHVQAEMVKQGAMLGGEQSGHILCHHYGVSGDGMLTALHLAALVQKSGQSLSELRDQSFQTYPQLLKNVRVEDRDRRLNWQNCDAFQHMLEQANATMGDQGRILVRASGTEPVLRIMVEAVEATLAEYWIDRLTQAAQQYL